MKSALLLLVMGFTSYASAAECVNMSGKYMGKENGHKISITIEQNNCDNAVLKYKKGESTLSYAFSTAGIQKNFPAAVFGYDDFNGIINTTMFPNSLGVTFTIVSKINPKDFRVFSEFYNKNNEGDLEKSYFDIDSKTIKTDVFKRFY